MGFVDGVATELDLTDAGALLDFELLGLALRFLEVALEFADYLLELLDFCHEGLFLNVGSCAFFFKFVEVLLFEFFGLSQLFFLLS